MGDWLIHDAVERAAHWNPDATAVGFEDRTYTFREFDVRVNRLARALADLGVSAGDRIAAHARNHADLLSAFYACSKLGAVYSPVSTFQSAENVRFIAGRLGASAVLYSADDRIVDGELPTLREALPEAAFVCLDDDPVGGDPAIDDLIAGYDGSAPAGADRHDPDVDHNVFWTSGTTGRPKAAVRDHHSTLAFSDAFEARLPTAEMERRLVVSNMMFIGPYFRDGIAAPASGSALYVLREFDPAVVCERVREHGIDAIQMGFTLQKALVDHVEREGIDLDLGHVYGAITSAEVGERLCAVSENVYNIYGQTEAGHPTVRRLDPPLVDGRVPMGTPVATSDVRVVATDADRGDLPDAPPEPGERGELVVRSAGAMVRYMDPEKQREHVHDGWVYTGDVVGVDGNGELFFVDRADDRIRSGGVNVYPSEVERVLEAHPGVEEAVVVGVPDETWGERVCALVVHTGDGDPDALFRALDDRCLESDALAREMRPRGYAAVRSSEAVPTGAVDKVDRDGIVARFFS